MAKRRKKSSARKARRRSASSGSRCCPVIQVRCKATSPGQPKMCSVRVGGGRVKKVNSVKAGRLIGKLVRAQQKRRCRPVVKGSTG